MHLIKQITALLAAVFSGGASADSAAVTIHIEGLKTSEGVVYAGLCTEDGWETYDCNSVALKPGKGALTHQWQQLEPGTYGITLLHDRNENGKMDFNFFGAPVEQWGTSNNPAPRMGPSLWRDAKFELNAEPIVLTIRMQPED